MGQYPTYKILSEDLIQFRQKYSTKRPIHSMQSQSISQLAFQKIDKFILNSIWTIRGPRVAKKKKKCWKIRPNLEDSKLPISKLTTETQ